LCSNAEGGHSHWNGTSNTDGTINCTCDSGYTWNVSQKTCAQQVAPSQTASVGGANYDKEVAALQSLVQILLAKIAALQAAKAGD
jgi:hypothetical protein